MVLLTLFPKRAVSKWVWKYCGRAKILVLSKSLSMVLLNGELVDGQPM